MATAVRDLVAVHSTDPASVFLGLAARVRDATVESIEREIYDVRSVVRMLGMRRTVHVVPVDLVPIVHASSTRAVRGSGTQTVARAPGASRHRARSDGLARQRRARHAARTPGAW